MTPLCFQEEDAAKKKKCDFLLRISLVNVTKSAGNFGFSHIY